MCLEIPQVLFLIFCTKTNLKNNMKIKVHLISQSNPIEHKDILNTYIKNGMYCLLLKDNIVYKYPLVNIFRVIES